jgi:CRP-like cAMP-binding protein
LADVAATRNAFAHFSFFEGLQPEAIAFLDSLAEKRELGPATVVFHQGDLGNDVFFLVEGSVEVLSLGEGRPSQRLAVLHAPTLFGEMSLIECAPRSATVKTLTDCSLHVLFSTDMYQLFEKWPDQYALLLHRLARTMARRLRGLDHDFT